jgi:hypothetical protein
VTRGIRIIQQTQPWFGHFGALKFPQLVMFWLWLGLKAMALARLGLALAWKNARPGQHLMALAWLGLALAQALA